MLPTLISFGSNFSVMPFGLFLMKYAALPSTDSPSPSVRARRLAPTRVTAPVFGSTASGA